MQGILSISQLIIPIMVLGIVFYGFIKGISVYDVFIEGAKEGVKVALEIFPYALAMFFAINILIDSQLLYFVLGFFKPVLHFLNINEEVMAMAFMRPLSGSATLSLMDGIFTKYGPDSLYGRIASTIQGSTDTTFYVLTLYFGSVGIKKIRYALFVGLFADVIGITASILLVNFFF